MQGGEDHLNASLEQLKSTAEDCRHSQVNGKLILICYCPERNVFQLFGLENLAHSLGLCLPPCAKC